jgi:hypothetical protein
MLCEVGGACSRQRSNGKKKNFTRKTGSDHSRDQDVEGDRKTVTGYWVDSFSFRSWAAPSSYEHCNQDIRLISKMVLFN